MKHILLLKYLSIILFFSGMILTGCNSPAKNLENAEGKVEEANENVIEAKQDIKNAQDDSIRIFKKEAEDRIAANEKSIAEYKTRIAEKKSKSKAKYEKQVAELDQKNSDLKKVLDEYKEQGKEKWISFKHKFNHDMDNLGKALKEFTTSNKK